jgi:MFS transporter, FSR family, fosmidomycin resistance protein
METRTYRSSFDRQWSDRWAAKEAQIPQQKQSVVGIILLALCFSHLLNDTIQSLIPAIYPVLKSSFRLNFGQIGLITLTFQLTSSLLQPLVGVYTDRNPKPFSLAVGMVVSLCGLVLLSRAWNIWGRLVDPWAIDNWPRLWYRKRAG